jgi:hypothetical protein
MRNQREIERRLVSMPGFRLLGRIQTFQISIHVFRENTRELREHLYFIEEDPKGFELFFERNRSKFKSTLLETTRYLHNFVASSKSLVDHSRVFYKELYRKNGLFPEYNQKVSELLAKDPEVQFVQSLRNFALHSHMPAPQSTMSFGDMKGIPTRRIEYTKDILDRYSDWSSVARQYIDSATYPIRIRTVVDSYERKVGDFYNWMWTRMREIHSGEIKEVEDYQAEIRRQMLPDVIMSVHQSINGQGFQLRDVFNSGLIADDHLFLSQFQNNSIWLEEALKIIAIKVGVLSKDLIEGLRAAVKEGRAI